MKPYTKDKTRRIKEAEERAARDIASARRYAERHGLVAKTTQKCDICGGTGDVQSRRFTLRGQVFEGPVCHTCSHCEECGQALRVTDDGAVWCDCEPEGGAR